MCGIVGIMSKRTNGLFHKDIEIFREMLFADQVRGAHGTGIFYSVDGVARTLKGPMPSSVFLRSETVGPVFNEIVQKSPFVIGHNRHATKGEINFENTHPFIEGNVTLIHNGTLYGHKQLKDVEVDSHAICHSISEIGAPETLKKLDGAFALVWFDQETQKLHFIRNSERPLFVIETGTLLIIASEPRMVEWILERKGEHKYENPVSCQVGHLYTYDTKKNTLKYEKVDIREKKSYSSYWKGSYWKDGKWSFDEPETTPYNPPAPSNLPIPHKPKDEKRYNSFNSVDIRTNDVVLFNPVDVHPHGTTFVLHGLVDTVLYNGVNSHELGKDQMVEVRRYLGDYNRLNMLLDHVLCQAKVIQTVYKSGRLQYVVVSDITPVAESKTDTTVGVS